MFVTTKVNIDLQKAAYPTTVAAVQGDLNTRRIEVALYSDGEAWQIPEGTTVAMRYRKPDRTGGYYDTMPDGTTAWSVQDNVITMMLAPQMLTVAGTVFAQLELIHDNSILGTFTINVRVEEDPAADALKSEDYVNWLEWLENELDKRLENGQTGGGGTTSGSAGADGATAVLLSAVVAYQESESGTEVPSGEWQDSIPSVEQGHYLWTRTVYTFNTGDPVTQYSVSRFGMDGSSVQKISAVLLASGWSDTAPYVQTIAVTGLTDEVNSKAYPEVPVGAIDEKIAFSAEIAKVRWCTRSGDTMTFECLEEKPVLDIPIVVEVYV